MNEATGSTSTGDYVEVFETSSEPGLSLEGSNLRETLRELAETNPSSYVNSDGMCFCRPKVNVEALIESLLFWTLFLIWNVFSLPVYPTTRLRLYARFYEHSVLIWGLCVGFFHFYRPS